MLNIFIGFVVIYLSFLLLLIAIKFVFSQFYWLVNISYNAIVKIANVSFGVAFLLFLMATIFVIPLNQDMSIKRSILFGLFSVSYFVIAIWAIYDQNKNWRND